MTNCWTVVYVELNNILIIKKYFFSLVCIIVMHPFCNRKIWVHFSYWAITMLLLISVILLIYMFLFIYMFYILMRIDVIVT